MKLTYNFKRSGFTLIEILVVIGIIALLAAILFPVLSRARESARSKSCMSNMQQLGLAFQQYTADYGRRYPGGGQYQKWGDGGHWIAGTDNKPMTYGINNPDKKPPNDPVGNGSGYDHANVEKGALYPYVRSTAVYICPSNADGDKKLSTYSMNCAIAGMNDVRLRTPTEIILLVDEKYANDGFFYTDSDKSTDTITDIHNGAGNILFTDGHAKAYTHGQYPLVSSTGNTASLALKTRNTGTPRFYDPAFGNYDSATKTGGYFSSAAFGSCSHY